MSYPTIKWIKSTLRNSVYAPRRVSILQAFIVGSEARGKARPDSDLDIAVVIPSVRGKTSLEYTENYHCKFPNNNAYPTWGGRQVDFQFFYVNDEELKTYDKIVLS